jgi:hypothetical protein
MFAAGARLGLGQLVIIRELIAIAVQIHFIEAKVKRWDYNDKSSNAKANAKPVDSHGVQYSSKNKRKASNPS